MGCHLHPVVYSPQPTVRLISNGAKFLVISNFKRATPSILFDIKWREIPSMKSHDSTCFYTRWQFFMKSHNSGRVSILDDSWKKARLKVSNAGQNFNRMKASFCDRVNTVNNRTHPDKRVASVIFAISNKPSRAESRDPRPSQTLC